MVATEATAAATNAAIEAERVHARVTPEKKLRFVRAWKERGAIVAMTGDGVNDAPALREAHIGIAMGRGGTEVTREAADMVLADDNCASIVDAMREGRAIWENITLHLLWVNLATDGVPALALVMDPADPGVLDQPPRTPGQAMLGRGEYARIVGVGILQASVVLGVFV